MKVVSVLEARSEPETNAWCSGGADAEAPVRASRGRDIRAAPRDPRPSALKSEECAGRA